MRETASKSGLLLSGCLRWAHPAARWYQDRPEDAKAREAGKAFHACLDLHAQGMPYAIPKDVEVKVRAAAKYFDTVLMPRCVEVHTEVAMGIDFASGIVEVPNVKDRGYPDSPMMFYGTADIVAVLKSGEILIADWKTGASDGAEEQLKSLALMARVVFGDKNPPVRISVLTASDDGEVIVYEREVAPAELDAHYASVRDAIAKSRSTAKPSLPVVGTHCTQQYCPHLAKCPATLGSFEGVASGQDGPKPKEYPWEEKPSDARHAGWMAMRIRAMKRAIAYYEGNLKDHVRSGGKAIYDGYEWAEGGAGFRFKKL